MMSDEISSRLWIPHFMSFRGINLFTRICHTISFAGMGCECSCEDAFLTQRRNFARSFRHFSSTPSVLTSANLLRKPDKVSRQSLMNSTSGFWSTTLGCHVCFQRFVFLLGPRHLDVYVRKQLPPSALDREKDLQRSILNAVRAAKRLVTLLKRKSARTIGKWKPQTKLEKIHC